MTYNKLVNGEIVPMSAEEISQRQAEEAAWIAVKLAQILTAYRDKMALVYTYKGVPIKLTDGARADLTALYFSVLMNQSIPNATVMANWQENGYETLQITAGDLRTDGHQFAEHRQKCFTAHDTVKANLVNYTTEQQIQGAFDAAYAA